MIFLIGLMDSFFVAHAKCACGAWLRERGVFFICATARDKRSLLERLLCLRYRSRQALAA